MVISVRSLLLARRMFPKREDRRAIYRAAKWLSFFRYKGVVVDLRRF
jgi:hypothetical protein